MTRLMTDPDKINAAHRQGLTFNVGEDHLYDLGKWVYENFEQVAPAIRKGMTTIPTIHDGYFSLSTYNKASEDNEVGIVFAYILNPPGKPHSLKTKSLNGTQRAILIGICTALHDHLTHTKDK